MKIVSVKPYLFHPGVGKNLLFTRVETDDGLYGWGEGYVVQGKEKAIAAYVESMTAYLLGRDPFEIRHTGRALFHDFTSRRGSAEFYAAWSSVEIALWDILGKALNQPVYNLLGGRFRTAVRAYANGWYDVNFGGDDTPKGMAERALRVRAMGYTAMKWDPFGRMPWRCGLSKADEDRAVECVREVRAAVGDDVDLLIECHRRLSPYHAKHFAGRIEPYRPFWLEEPCLADDIDLVAEVRDHVSLPVVTGETLITKEDFKGVFEKRAADVINPDVCICGIQNTVEIAAMAEAYAVQVSPHNYNSTAVGLAATLHVATAIPNFVICEHFLNIKPACDELVIGGPVMKDGFFEIPEGPGLGVDLKMDVLLAHPYQEFKREFPIKGVAYAEDEGPLRSNYIRKEPHP